MCMPGHVLLHKIHSLMIVLSAMQASSKCSRLLYPVLLTTSKVSIYSSAHAITFTAEPVFVSCLPHAACDRPEGICHHFMHY